MGNGARPLNFPCHVMHGFSQELYQTNRRFRLASGVSQRNGTAPNRTRSPWMNVETVEVTALCVVNGRNVSVYYLQHLSTRQYARLIDEWVLAIGVNARDFGTHSLRRTKTSLIHKATGSPRVVQILLGHSIIENTIHNLGADIDDALTLAECKEI